MSYIDPGAYTAVKSGTVTDEWGTHRVVARRSRWVLTYEQMRDPLIRDLFGIQQPSRSTHSISRSAPVSRSQFVRRDRDSGREIPDLIDAPQFPFELTLSLSARDGIAMELAETNGLLSRGGYEVGGFLLGRMDDLRHAYATTTAEGRRGALRSNTVSLDSSAITPAQTQLAADGIRADLIGDWHCHTRGSSQPSDTDLAAWLQARDLYRMARYVGVVAIPDRLWGWAQPALIAWCVKRLGTERRPVCEPVVVKEG
jgi:hypothetical protein